MYVKSTTWAGDLAEVRIYAPGRYGAPGEKREKKKQPSPEDIERQNHRNRVRKVQMMILLNFRDGYHVILKYPKDKHPDSYAEAKGDLDRFLRRMRDDLKARDSPFRWIAVTERGKRRAVLHHHLIVERIEAPELFSMPMLIRKNWPGHAEYIDMYDDGQYEDLAEYLVKKETKEECEGTRYRCSRNLQKPKVERELVHGRPPDEPEAPPGWEVVKDSGADRQNPLTGRIFRRYFIRKLPEFAPAQEKCTVKETENRPVGERIKRWWKRLKKRWSR